MADPVISAPVAPAPAAVAPPAVIESAPAPAAPSQAAPATPTVTSVPVAVEGTSEGAVPVLPAEAAPSPAPAEVKPGDKPAADAKPAEPGKPSFLESAKADATKSPTEAKPGETPAEPVEGEKPAEAAPIVYETFKVPEGLALDEGVVKDFTAILAEAKAPQEVGQKMIDLYFKEVDKIGKYQNEVWDRTQEQWLNDIRSDAEIGGSRIETVHQTCGAVIERFGNENLRKALTMTGMGNHPEMVRFLNKIGSFLGEGKPIPSARPAPAPAPSRAQRRYAATLNGSPPSP